MALRLSKTRCMYKVHGEEVNADQGHHGFDYCLVAGSISSIAADNSKQCRTSLLKFHNTDFDIDERNFDLCQVANLQKLGLDLS